MCTYVYTYIRAYTHIQNFTYPHTHAHTRTRTHTIDTHSDNEKAHELCDWLIKNGVK